MLCPKCNHQNPEKAKFCAKCGEPLVASQAQSPIVSKETSAEATNLGIPQNVGGALCYFLGPVTGIIFLLLEKKDKFIRFHAWQSTIVFGGLLALRYALNFFLFTAWQSRSFIYTLINMAGVILWIVLMVKAYQGEKYKLPVVGEIAEKQA